jgi:hypothetical protein
LPEQAVPVGVIGDGLGQDVNMASVQYFAYGSNMLTERLQARCKSATVRCVASADEYRFAFSKKSRDGSGKATIRPDAASRVYGVVFNLNETELPVLDKYEGAGYDRIEKFQIYADGLDRALDVVTYVASPGATDPDLKPYDWYLKLVIAGARQHGLPSQYVSEIEAVQTIADLTPDRKSRLKALKLLGE